MTVSITSTKSYEAADCANFQWKTEPPMLTDRDFRRLNNITLVIQLPHDTIWALLAPNSLVVQGPDEAAWGRVIDKNGWYAEATSLFSVSPPISNTSGPVVAAPLRAMRRSARMSGDNLTVVFPRIPNLVLGVPVVVRVAISSYGTCRQDQLQIDLSVAPAEDAGRSTVALEITSLTATGIAAGGALLSFGSSVTGAQATLLMLQAGAILSDATCSTPRSRDFGHSLQVGLNPFYYFLRGTTTGDFLFKTPLHEALWGAALVAAVLMGHFLVTVVVWLIMRTCCRGDRVANEARPPVPRGMDRSSADEAVDGTSLPLLRTSDPPAPVASPPSSSLAASVPTPSEIISARDRNLDPVSLARRRRLDAIEEEAATASRFTPLLAAMNAGMQQQSHPADVSRGGKQRRDPREGLQSKSVPGDFLSFWEQASCVTRFPDFSLTLLAFFFPIVLWGSLQHLLRVAPSYGPTTSKLFGGFTFMEAIFAAAPLAVVSVFLPVIHYIALRRLQIKWQRYRACLKWNAAVRFFIPLGRWWPSKIRQRFSCVLGDTRLGHRMYAPAPQLMLVVQCIIASLLVTGDVGCTAQFALLAGLLFLGALIFLFVAPLRTSFQSLLLSLQYLLLSGMAICDSIDATVELTGQAYRVKSPLMWTFLCLGMVSSLHGTMIFVGESVSECCQRLIAHRAKQREAKAKEELTAEEERRHAMEAVGSPPAAALLVPPTRAKDDTDSIIPAASAPSPSGTFAEEEMVAMGAPLPVLPVAEISVSSRAVPTAPVTNPLLSSFIWAEDDDRSPPPNNPRPAVPSVSATAEAERKRRRDRRDKKRYGLRDDDDDMTSVSTTPTDSSSDPDVSPIRRDGLSRQRRIDRLSRAISHQADRPSWSTVRPWRYAAAREGAVLERTSRHSPLSRGMEMAGARSSPVNDHVNFRVLLREPSSEEVAAKKAEAERLEREALAARPRDPKLEGWKTLYTSLFSGWPEVASADSAVVDGRDAMHGHDNVVMTAVRSHEDWERASTSSGGSLHSSVLATTEGHAARPARAGGDRASHGGAWADGRIDHDDVASDHGATGLDNDRGGGRGGPPHVGGVRSQGYRTSSRQSSADDERANDGNSPGPPPPRGDGPPAGVELDEQNGYYDEHGGYVDATGGYFDPQGGYYHPQDVGGGYTAPDGTYFPDGPPPQRGRRP